MADGAFDPTVGLDQSEIADIVNRKKISNTRQRREMMRMGNTDQASFVQQSQPQIQQAQQPQEFWGAGRKLAQNQNVGDDLYSIFGQSLPKLGGDLYYYGDNDYSTAQIGTQGYDLVDKGKAVYDITKDGNVLGQFYGSVADAINSYRQKLAEGSVKEYNAPIDSEAWWQTPEPTKYTIDARSWNVTNGEWDNNTLYNTREEALQQALSGIPQYTPKTGKYASGEIQDWEVLGQLLSGNTDTDIFSNKDKYYFTGNNKTEKISGLDQLYGSQPIIHNGKILGYKTDLAPVDQGDFARKNPLVAGWEDTGGSTRSQSYLYRNLDNIDQWKGIGQFLNNEGDYFIPTENISKMPGWSQGDINWKKHQSNSLLSKIASIAGPVLSMVPGMQPVGMMINAANAAYKGSPLGMLTSFLPATGITKALTSSLSGATGLSSAVSGGLVNAGIGGLGSALSGGNFLQGALSSGLGSLVGGGLKGLFNSDLAAGLGGAVAKQAASNIMNKNQQKNLEGLFQSRNTMTLEQPTNEDTENPKNKRDLLQRPNDIVERMLI